MRRFGIAGLLIVGLALILFSLFINDLSHWIVLSTVDDLNRGASLASYQDALRSLLAPRATIRVVPGWVNAIAGGSGVACWYLAGYLLLNPTRSLRDLLRFAYWREFSGGWSYTPFSEQLARARKALEKTTPP